MHVQVNRIEICEICEIIALEKECPTAQHVHTYNIIPYQSVMIQLLTGSPPVVIVLVQGRSEP